MENSLNMIEALETIVADTREPNRPSATRSSVVSKAQALLATWTPYPAPPTRSRPHSSFIRAGGVREASYWVMIIFVKIHSISHDTILTFSICYGEGETPLLEVPFQNLSKAWEWATKGGFNVSQPTKIIVHGFGSSCSHVWVYEMRSALMSVVSVIFFDSYRIRN